jgi:hypothetical protein
MIEMAWLELPSGFELECTDNLVNPNWGPVGVAPTVQNGVKRVTVPANATSRFYRLRK